LKDATEKKTHQQRCSYFISIVHMPHFLDETKELHESVAKKQKTTISQLTQEIDNLIECIEQCKQEITQKQGSNQLTGVLTQTDKSKEFVSLTNKLSSQIKKCHRSFQVAHKEYHNCLTKYGKSIDKSMKTNQEDALLRDPWNIKQGVLNEIIAQHLFREGFFEVADIFEREANVKLSDKYKKSFLQMFEVIKKLDERDVSLALQWCKEHNREYSLLAFMCHKLQFIKLLVENKNGIEAIKYARENLSPFSAHEGEKSDMKNVMNEIKFLMGSILYMGRLQESEHYKSLLDTSLWDEVKELFKKECCSLTKQAAESPLYVSIAAGSQALPTLLKMISVAQLDRESLQNMEQLGVELDGVDQMFHFHSIFACPVSKENYVSPDNPPMLLPCGHVLIKSSILKLVRATNQRFKCPYCPEETAVSQCRPISF
jgi:hypothetical protein